MRQSHRIRLFRERLSNTEIDDLDHRAGAAAFREHQIRRLQIAMNQALFLGRCQRAADLQGDFHGVCASSGPVRRTRVSSVSPSTSSIAQKYWPLSS